MFGETEADYLRHDEGGLTDNGLPSLFALRRLSLLLSVLIFISNAGGIVLGSVCHLLSFFSLFSQASLATAALALAALEAPPPASAGHHEGPIWGRQRDLGGGNAGCCRRKSSPLERGVVACVVGVFGLWHFWVNPPSGILSFLLTLMGLLEVSLHFIGWGEAEATRALRSGTAFAKGVILTSNICPSS